MQPKAKELLPFGHIVSRSMWGDLVKWIMVEREKTQTGYMDVMQ